MLLADIKKITDTPKSYIIHVNLNGEIHPCILHDAQYDPITDDAIHIDFLAISEDKPVQIAVPVNIFGNAEGVKQGGRLRVGVRKVKVCGPLEKLPDQIDVDITTLGVGKAIYAGQLSVEGCQIASPKKLMVCEIKRTRAAAAAAAAETEEAAK